MEVSIKSDIGRKRELNEDSILANVDDNFTLIVIADGMGGHKAGEVASEMATRLVDQYVRDNINSDIEALALVERSMVYANDEIYSNSKANEDRIDMGTTCDTCLIQEKDMYVGHVGDSRVYLYRNNGLRQITKDHSLYNEINETGNIPLEEIEKIASKNIITRALGGEKGVRVDQHYIQLEEGDLVLLCTDGLSNEISDEDIKTVLSEELSLDYKAEKLVQMANDAGGADNITLGLIRVR